MSRYVPLQGCLRCHLRDRRLRETVENEVAEVIAMHVVDVPVHPLIGKLADCYKAAVKPPTLMQFFMSLEVSLPSQMLKHPCGVGGTVVAVTGIVAAVGETPGPVRPAVTVPAFNDVVIAA